MRYAATSKTTTALLLSLFFLPGCKSLTQQVDELTNDGSYYKALQILTKKGAGVDISPKANKEAIQARILYQKKVEAYCKSSVDNALSSGFAR